MSNHRVIVGMSGGVDSSVAAALLVEQGYDVIGIAMRLWGDASGSGCCSLDDFLDARRVATRLGIPFYVMDFRADFERSVVAPFVREYLQGRTPNPCARCNQFVKFDSLWERARELGADWIATGHYARVRHEPDHDVLLRARDETKDQSYYLFGIEPQVLRHCLFPIGDLTKTEVRERARALGLSVADKPESQEICFAPKGQYAEFVARYAGAEAQPSGDIVDSDGQVRGRHDGIHRFTVGQRRGLGISGEEPLYVLAVNPQTAEVRVGPKAATIAAGLVASQAKWLGAQPPVGSRLSLKIRSRFAAAGVTILAAAADRFELVADQGLAAVTPGQAAVLYDGDVVVGGGWIERSLGAAETESR